ncbi:hypothetical protein HMPREF1609_03690 [Escherichia coli 908541]|nr:hypothetical protein HMPREF1609_03690 [Escherichia coli 908541]
MEAKGRNIGQQEIWHHYWIIEIGETFKTFYHEQLRRVKPATKRFQTISLIPPKWLF